MLKLSYLLLSINLLFFSIKSLTMDSNSKGFIESPVKPVQENYKNIISIVKTGLCSCINNKYIAEKEPKIINNKYNKYSNKMITILNNQILFNLLLQFLNQDDSLKLRLINKKCKENFYIYSKNFKPIQLKENINPDNITEHMKWLYNNHEKLDFSISTQLSDCAIENNAYIKEEYITEIFNLVKNNLQVLHLFCFNLDKINQEVLYTSNIKNLIIKNCINIDNIFSNKCLPNNLIKLTIALQKICDNQLKALPEGLKKLDLSLAYGQSGIFLKFIPKGLKKIKLGIDLDEKNINNLPINIKSLCLKNTTIKSFMFLFNLQKLLTLCINKEFAAKDIIFLPENLKSLYIDNKNTIFSGKNFKYLPEKLKHLKFYNLNSIANALCFYMLQKNISHIYIEDDSYETINNNSHTKKIEFLEEIGIKVKNFAGTRYLDKKNIVKYKSKKMNIFEPTTI